MPSIMERKKEPRIAVRSADTKRPIAVRKSAVSKPSTGAKEDWRRENIGRLLLFAFHAFEERIIAGYQTAGFDDVRQVHMNAVRHVDPQSGTRIVELAARAGVTKAAMGQMLEDCVRHDLVKIAPDPTDSRAKIVRLTARGAAFMAATQRSMLAIQREFEQALGAPGYRTLIGKLRQLRARLGEDDKPSRF